MPFVTHKTFLFWSCVALGVFVLSCAHSTPRAPARAEPDATSDEYVQSLLEEGKRTFRFDTFGSEAFWGGRLRVHDAIRGEKLGGVGQGISPKQALALGLKVDATAVPAAMAA